MGTLAVCAGAAGVTPVLTSEWRWGQCAEWGALHQLLHAAIHHAGRGTMAYSSRTEACAACVQDMVWCLGDPHHNSCHASRDNSVAMEGSARGHAAGVSVSSGADHQQQAFQRCCTAAGCAGNSQAAAGAEHPTCPGTAGQITVGECSSFSASRLREMLVMKL